MHALNGDLASITSRYYMYKLNYLYLLLFTHWCRVTHMRQETRLSLVQIMACRLLGAKPISDPCYNTVNWTLRNELQRNSYIWNTFENVVWEMAAILSRPQRVKYITPLAFNENIDYSEPLHPCVPVLKGPNKAVQMYRVYGYIGRYQNTKDRILDWL